MSAARVGAIIYILQTGRLEIFNRLTSLKSLLKGTSQDEMKG